MTALLYYMLWLTSPQTIDLPLEIEAVDQILLWQNQLVIRNQADHELHVLNPDGTVLHHYRKRGEGPGEYLRLFHVGSWEQGLTLTDMFTRKVILLNQKLEYVAEHQFATWVRQVHQWQDRFYLIAWNEVDQTAIQIYDSGWKQIARCGSGLDGAALAGLQAGNLIKVNNKLLFVHSYIPKFQWFDLDGKSLETKWFPGFDTPFARIESLTTNQYPIPYLINHLWYRDGFIFVHLDTRNKPGVLLQYNLLTKDWQRTKVAANLIFDSQGNPWQITESSDPESPITLQSINKKEIIP